MILSGLSLAALGLVLAFAAQSRGANLITLAVKVASSWLIAVAILAVALKFLPVTPGYMPDHLQ